MDPHCSCDPRSPGHLARNFEEFVVRNITFIVPPAGPSAAVVQRRGPCLQSTGRKLCDRSAGLRRAALL